MVRNKKNRRKEMKFDTVEDIRSWPLVDGWSVEPVTGKRVYLGYEVEIGDGVKLGDFVKLGYGVEIGDEVELGTFVTLVTGRRLVTL